MKPILVILTIILTSFSFHAQTDPYDQMEVDYDSLRKEKKYEEALVMAKQMNAWALENESDTSLRYAKSLFLQGHIEFDKSNLQLAYDFYRATSLVLETKKIKTTDEYDLLVNANYYNALVSEQLDDEISIKENALRAVKFRQNVSSKLHQTIGYCFYYLVLFGEEAYLIEYSAFGIEYLRKNNEIDPFYLSFCFDELIYQYSPNNYEEIENVINDAITYFEQQGHSKYVLNYLVKMASLKQEVGENTNTFQNKISDLIGGLNIGDINDPVLLTDILGVLPTDNNYLRSIIKQLNIVKKYAEPFDKFNINLNLIDSYIFREKYFECKSLLRENNILMLNNNFNDTALVSYFFYQKAQLLSRFGDHKNAIPFFQKTYDSYLELGHDYNHFLNTINFQIAESYYYTQQYMAAKNRLYSNLKSKNRNPLNYDLMGSIHWAQGNYKEACKFAKKAHRYCKRVDDLELKATVQNNLANILAELKRYKKSEKLYKLSLSNYANLEDNEESISLVEEQIAELYFLTNQVELGVKYLISSYNRRQQHILVNLKWQNSNLISSNIQAQRYLMSQISSYAAKYANNGFLQSLSFNSKIFHKYLILQAEIDVRNVVKASNDIQLIATYDVYKNKIDYFNKLKFTHPTSTSLNNVSEEIDSIETILKLLYYKYSDFETNYQIGNKEIINNLNPTEAAIEFAKYYDDVDSVSRYIALVVRPGYEYPKLALLGEEQEIREYIENRAFEALYPMVWEPIEKHLSGVNRIYYSPAGQLNNLSFSALCMGERKELSQKDKDSIIARGEILTESTSSFECEYLMDRYELHQLTTTRYIADGTLDKQTTMNTSIALGGGINYDTIPKAHSENKEEDNTEYIFALNLQQEQEKAKENTKRSSKNTSKMSYLEGTKKEVDQVAALFQNKNWSLSAYTDTKAEEGKFKEEVEKNKAGIIHIATHGFAFPDVKKNKRQQLMGTEEISYRASEDPMVRCGLMFSGSNVSWTGNLQKMIEETGEDGILTAAEVSNMDLSNTKLVVLSACETGLGKIEGSEGTFGLKRGFKLAGVEQMIVSLWSVPDKETMELMTLFYEDLTQSLNPVTSFEKAQKQMRETYPTRPDLWAGFVLVR